MEKSYDEFCRLIEYRNHWGIQCDLYENRIGELQERIDKLTKAGRHIKGSAQNVQELMLQMKAMPSFCPEWAGFQADRVLGACREGDLYQAYDHYKERLGFMLETIESERNRLSVQLEEINSSYIEARSNYVCWANRAAYYWN